MSFLVFDVAQAHDLGAPDCALDLMPDLQALPGAAARQELRSFAAGDPPPAASRPQVPRHYDTVVDDAAFARWFAEIAATLG